MSDHRPDTDSSPGKLPRWPRGHRPWSPRDTKKLIRSLYPRIIDMARRRARALNIPHGAEDIAQTIVGAVLDGLESEIPTKGLAGAVAMLNRDWTPESDLSDEPWRRLKVYLWNLVRNESKKYLSGGMARTESLSRAEVADGLKVSARTPEKEAMIREMSRLISELSSDDAASLIATEAGFDRETAVTLCKSLDGCRRHIPATVHAIENLPRNTVAKRKERAMTKFAAKARSMGYLTTLLLATLASLAARAAIAYDKETQNSAARAAIAYDKETQNSAARAAIA